MADIIVIIAAGIFAAGVVAGIIAVISIGIHREERRFRIQQDLSLGGEMADVHLPQEAPDRVTGGARRLMGLYVRRQPASAPIDQQLLV
jgi:hypothetical protein